MLDISLKVLNKIENKGYKAYIVGGFVRDYIIGRTSSDVDISTNATPKQIKEIFPNTFIPNEAYGSITVIFDKVRFEITTFRKELKYINNRKPVEIEYIDDLVEDLKRRDFTINTLCIDSGGNIIDLLDNRTDIDNKIIKTVSNSVDSFSEDALRILRAVRFATVLDFELDCEIIKAIDKTKKYLSNISYNRKKSELDKIFMSKNAKYGIDLLIQLGLDIELEINNLKEIRLSNDLIGMWSSLDVSDNYPFTKSEKELIGKIRMLSKYDAFGDEVLYKYGPYVISIVMINNNKDSTEIKERYDALPIKSRSEILITGTDIMNILKKAPGRYISQIFDDLESAILMREIPNQKENIIDYVLQKYGDIDEKRENAKVT